MYSRQILEQERTFGVSGLLYRGNLLMFDRETESLWSQIRSEAVTGPLTGTRLAVLPSTLTTWERWRSKYPATQVLSFETGYERNYEIDPYHYYYQQQKGFWSFFPLEPGETEKELVVGIAIKGAAKAYPLVVLRQQGRLEDQIAGQKVLLEFDPATDNLTVRDAQGSPQEHVTAYWFVWKALWPETQRF